MKIASFNNLEEADSLQIYFREISDYPLLSREDEVKLARQIKCGDAEARFSMIRSNLRLVVKIAHQYSHMGVPIQDLISEGNIGLMKAVEKFDGTRGIRFSTYGALWIKAAIKIALANQGKTIRMPVHAVEKQLLMRQIAIRLTNELRREPTDEELGIEMGLPTEKVTHLRTISMPLSSLEAPIPSEDSLMLKDLVADEVNLDPFENLQDKDLREDILEMVQGLEERENMILTARFGLDGNKPSTLDCIGKKMKLTRERIRQIQNIGLQKMRKMLDTQDNFCENAAA